MRPVEKKPLEPPQHINDLSTLPNDVIGIIAKGLDAKDRASLSQVSKSLKCVREMSPKIVREVSTETLKGKLKFDVRLFAQLTKNRRLGYDDDGNTLFKPYLMLHQNRDNKIDNIEFDRNLYKQKDEQRALVYGMMNDAGFYELIYHLKKHECDKVDRPYFITRLVQGILGGLIALVSSCIALALILPLIPLSEVICPNSEGGFPFTMVSPVCILYSTLQSLDLSYHSNTSLITIISNSIKGSFLMMWRWCFAPNPFSEYGEGPHNPWYELGVTFRDKKSFFEIASEWSMSKHREKFSPPTQSQEILRQICLADDLGSRTPLFALVST